MFCNFHNHKIFIKILINQPKIEFKVTVEKNSKVTIWRIVGLLKTKNISSSISGNESTFKDGRGVSSRISLNLINSGKGSFVLLLVLGNVVLLLFISSCFYIVTSLTWGLDLVISLVSSIKSMLLSLSDLTVLVVSWASWF